MKLRAENLVKTYKGRSVVKGISVEVNQGEIVGLLGPNGAGKTTSFYMIVGLVKPNSGKIFLNDMDITDFPMYKRAQNGIGYLAQEASVFRKLSIEDNILSVLQLTKLSKEEQVAKMESLIAEFSLEHIRTNRGDLLSGGERRRLFLLRVLMSAPNVLILDEPTNDLDVQTLAILEEYLEDFNGCVIVVSHDRYFLDRVVDTIFSFETGGNIRQYPGNYSLYLDQKKEEEEPKEKKVTPKTVKASPSPVNKKISFKEKKEYEDIEKQIPILEAKKAEIEQVLYGEPLEDFTKITALTEELAQLSQKIDNLTDRWLELAEKLG